MKSVMLIIVLLFGFFSLGSYVLNHPIYISIIWGNWGDITFTNTMLFIMVIVFLIVFYSVSFLLGLRKRMSAYQNNRLPAQANSEFAKGLVHFTEGHWKRSEKILMENVDYSQSPLLNYLVAARSAHLQEAYNRRDEYLKKASEVGDDVQTAVSVSQAEMQFSSGQFEQARATLIHLLELSPKHPYAIKLLAKIYYQQEDWDNLFSLLPELNKQSLIKEKDRSRYEATALRGIFMTLAEKSDRKKIQTLWKKLPNDICEKPEAILLYCEALSDAGDSASSDKLLIASLSKNLDETLIERYGLIHHDNLGNAIKQAEKWLETNPTSPNLLLALARLNRKYQLWGKSKVYYNSSLNSLPSAAIYLELAELLEELGETENAEICYKLGLKYSINHQGEILNLKRHNSADSSLAVAQEIDDDVISIG